MPRIPFVSPLGTLDSYKKEEEGEEEKRTIHTLIFSYNDIQLPIIMFGQTSDI